MKNTNDEVDLLPDSIVYFYPTKDNAKKQVESIVSNKSLVIPFILFSQETSRMWRNHWFNAIFQIRSFLIDASRISF
jgi:hypothetical protein